MLLEPLPAGHQGAASASLGSTPEGDAGVLSRSLAHPRMSGLAGVQEHSMLSTHTLPFPAISSGFGVNGEI